jgi:hypothetical protein
MQSLIHFSIGEAEVEVLGGIISIILFVDSPFTKVAEESLLPAVQS